MWMNPEYFWSGGMWIIPVFMAVVMLAALYLIFGRGGWRGPCGRGDDLPARKDSESASDILKKRYAKGELSKEEFDRMKQDIADD
jgi:putative membrane protein